MDYGRKHIVELVASVDNDEFDGGVGTLEVITTSPPIDGHCVVLPEKGTPHYDKRLNLRNIIYHK